MRENNIVEGYPSSQWKSKNMVYKVSPKKLNTILKPIKTDKQWMPYSHKFRRKVQHVGCGLNKDMLL